MRREDGSQTSPTTGAGTAGRVLGIWPGDIVGGLSVAAVLIPQSIAYATLAGMPAERGLVVAALAPLAAALLASSPYLATGPTAITSLLTFGGLTALAIPESPRYIALAALLALLVGGMRIVLGAARGGFVAYLLSQPIILGFTAGAAVVIVASQVPGALGVQVDATNAFAGAIEALRDPGAWEPAAVGISIGVALVIIGGRRIHRLFPGVLVAIALATIASEAIDYGGPVVGTIEAGLPSFSLSLPWSSTASLLLPAAVIAVVGFSEPASIARYYATLERRRWNPNRELLSQGFANVAAGLSGGFPAGGSFSRSAIMRDAGARTRLAGGLTGLVVLALMPFASILSPLPIAALAATIIVAVKELIRVEPFLEYRRYARLQFAIALTTFILTVVTAPHVERAVVIGVGLAISAHLWREMRLSIPSWTSDGTLHLAPKGVLYFASAPGMERAFAKLLHEHREADRLVIHLDGLGRVDLTGALVLRDLMNDARRVGLDAQLADIPPQAAKIVGRVIEGQT